MRSNEKVNQDTCANRNDAMFAQIGKGKHRTKHIGINKHAELVKNVVLSHNLDMHQRPQTCQNSAIPHDNY